MCPFKEIARNTKNEVRFYLVQQQSIVHVLHDDPLMYSVSVKCDCVALAWNSKLGIRFGVLLGFELGKGFGYD